MQYVITSAETEQLETLSEAITDYNIQVAKELPRAHLERLDFIAHDTQGTLLGGIQAYFVNWGILHVELVYVFENFRHQGIASMLLQHTETLAKTYGCYLSQLDTFDFQAKDFYLKNDYTIFGVLENAPKGHQRFYMKKDL
ncbi:MAG: GNAT family N-acetyltransferase [Chlamydiales bacterium]|nr:GNAT family N-acetyltransferase [Chlamydiales bacterium]